MSSLSNKVSSGLAWSFLDNLANGGVPFLVGLILARILTPEEFGILGILLVFIAIATIFVDGGLSSALIRKLNPSVADFNTVFYTNLFISLIVYIILFISSPSISLFFEQPDIVIFLRTLGLILFLNAFSIIQRVILTKEINFKIQTYISITSSVSSGILGIVMAYLGFGVWSLIAQQISRQFLITVLFWLWNSWRPTLIFSKQSFRELFGFGSKLLVSGLIDTIYRNMYYLIIGKFYSPYLLGQYTRAEQFNAIFSTNLTSTVQKVTYPALSQLQLHPRLLRQSFRRILTITALISFTCMLGLAAIAKPLILILIGDKWLVAVDYLQILCFAGMLYPIHALNLNILQVKGRSDLFLKLEIIKKVIGCISILLGIFYGIKIMLISSVIISVICLFINGYYTKFLINYTISQQVRDLLPILFISFCISSITYTLTLLPFTLGWILLIQISLEIILTLAIYNVIKFPVFLELKKLLLRSKG